MSAFTDRLEELLGEAGDVTDIRVTVRRCWLFDFEGYPTRIWQGQGKLYSADGAEWLGSQDGHGGDYLRVPRLSDGRDGSSPSYTFSLGYLDAATYTALKADRWRVAGREMTCYLALFEPGEGLRPATPLDFFARYTLQSPQFEESLGEGPGGVLVKRYRISVIAKDANAGRSRAPGRTYTYTGQKEYALRLGVADDLGGAFVAGLANKTYVIP